MVVVPKDERVSVVRSVTSPDAFADRALRNFADRTSHEALGAVLEAHRLLGLTLGVEIAERRNHDDALQNAVADGRLYQTLLHAYQEIASILIDHIQKIHRSHRAHYSPEQRFRILRVRGLLGWTQNQTAGCFDVAPIRLPAGRTRAKLVPRAKPSARSSNRSRPYAVSPTSSAVWSRQWPPPVSGEASASPRPSPGRDGTSPPKPFEGSARKSQLQSPSPF
jgi:hypothetical protein